MLKFTTTQPTGSFGVYPDSASIYAKNDKVQYELELIQDMDGSSLGRKVVYRINTPTDYDPRLVFQAYSGSIPANTGQYTSYVYEREVSGTWSEVSNTWMAEIRTFSEIGGTAAPRLIDTDRAYVQGTNDETITRYDQPASDNYTTYNG